VSETTPQAIPATELEMQNYRIRRIEIVLDLDLYDDDGFLVRRGKTDMITVVEAQFPPTLVLAMKALTVMRRGFAMRPTLPVSEAPVV
jgi:hypothetical protein